jgi:ABC-2 type transport system permease protein
LLAIFKDPRGRIVLFGPIVLQTLLFGYAASFDLNVVPYIVFDQDRSSAARDLIAHVEGSGVFTRVREVDSVAAMQDAIDRKKALLAVHIPADFERRLESADAAPVQAIIDGRNSNTAATAASYLRALVESFNAKRAEERGMQPSALRVEMRAWYNENLETRWQMIPSLIAALSMLQTMMLTALSVAREREQGTFDQLLVTPLRPGEIMVGKAVPPIAIGLGQSTLIFLLALLWFRIPFGGSLATLYVALLAFTVASVGIGLAISASSANMQQAMLYTFVLLMPMMLLSGLTSSIANMPEIMQWATYANPLRYAIDFVQRVYLEGAGLALILHDLWPLALIAAVTLPVAAWLFRHRLV